MSPGWQGPDLPPRPPVAPAPRLQPLKGRLGSHTPAPQGLVRTSPAPRAPSPSRGRACLPPHDPISVGARPWHPDSSLQRALECRRGLQGTSSSVPEPSLLPEDRAPQGGTATHPNHSVPLNGPSGDSNPGHRPAAGKPRPLLSAGSHPASLGGWTGAPGPAGQQTGRV